MPNELVIPNALKPLARLLDEPKPNVLIVVGTGVSIGATGDPRASWKGLLLDAVSRIESLEIEKTEILAADRILIEKAFTGNFDLDEILQRAESIIRRLGGVGDARFAEWLRDSVGTLNLNPDRRQSLDAIADLARAGALILTTNYDSLLSQVTGFDPVTWEEPNKILEVVNRQRKGIIHVHGHWSRPSSVVLGRSSYDRIKSASLSQTEFRSLWLQWHWLYLGCGSGGMDDPNLGALLQWAYDAALRDSALSDYFLSTMATVDALPDRIGKSANLVKFAYDDHAVDLPPLLRGLAPEARPSPFRRIGPDARRVRRPDESPLLSPFPSWEEYLDGVVPTFSADEEVIRRLDQHGWAFVLDVASVGKTTLAYRIATRPEYRHTPTYHLLLSQFTVDEAENDISPQAALARLSRPGALIVIDDAHQRPELAQMLWQQWRERQTGSKCLILATRMERSVNLPGESSLQDLETYATNPAVIVQPTPENLRSIASYVLARLEGPPLALNPPQEALSTWHRSFGREIGAFVVAVSQRRSELTRGNFELPESAAATWMKERHLGNLELADLKNAACLSVFGESEFELDVPVQCLPHPARIDRLLKSGLLERVFVGGGRFVRYSLREPGWGRLILAAAESPPNRLALIIESAVKSINFLVVISSRLHRAGRREEFRLYWQEIARALPTQPGKLAELALEGQLTYLSEFLTTALQQGQKVLVDELWHALAAQLETLTEHAFTTAVDDLCKFLKTAAQQGQATLVEGLWRALAAQPDRLAKRASETSLDSLATFLKTAIQQGQTLLIEELWRALAAQPRKLAEHALETPLNSLATFLKAALQQGQSALVDGVWCALAAQPDRLTERALETMLDDLCIFLNTAAQQGQTILLEGLWRGLAAQPSKLAECAFATPLSPLGSFLNIAKKQGQRETVDKLWRAFAAQPERLAKRAFETTLGELGAFLKIAGAHGQQVVVDGLWRELTARPARLAEWTLETPLHFVLVFLNAAKQQGQKVLVQELWHVLAAHPDKFVEQALATSLNGIGAFANVAQREGQTALAEGLWRALVAQPDRLAERALDTPFGELGELLSTAAEQGQKALVERLWSVLATKQDWIAERAFASPFNDFSAFLKIAARQGQNALVEGIWRVLAAQPDRLAERALGQTTTALQSFLNLAPDNLKRDIIQRFKVEHWEYGPYQAHRITTGAAGLAAQFRSFGRDDLKIVLVDNILRRKNRADFGDLRYSLAEMSRLLSLAAPDQGQAIIELLEIVCTEKWLAGAYTAGSTLGLAGALHMIAVYQPPSIIRRFWNQALGGRLRKEFSNLALLDDQGVNAAVELLGASSLIGWSINRSVLFNAPLNRISQLPQIFKHRSEAMIVEQWPRQTWFGLRVIASISASPLAVDPTVIIETLNLWRNNIGGIADWPGTKQMPDSTAHRINASMVEWLEDCARTTTGQLLPNREPLWVLAGFPRVIRDEAHQA